ncbi:ArsC/Spx/MgsR family protein [Hyphomonas johnsonii]|uniref:ArsC family protein n=1 Tax=Hyphomonas johnsonii MHS-2 TaxID=1280950 RepID=A0A059FP71_9PROT|nr:ArsC/Spx/MgsR family protein [Hyphomonas johnsonii]KCZ92326.1 ArsC family protein [Hyphomonas johnsonii MHS-2]
MSIPPLTLYGLKNCDTCRKALAALTTAGHDVAFVDIRAEADLPARVPAWLKAVGAEKLVNRRSTTWRGLTTAQQAGALGDGAAALLIANPALIKRPVIDTGADILVGWDKGTEQALKA